MLDSGNSDEADRSGALCKVDSEADPATEEHSDAHLDTEADSDTTRL
jgi:hypothetical protein